MLENISFILVSFFAAWILGRLLDRCFERMFPAVDCPAEHASDVTARPVRTEYRQLERLFDKS